MRYGRHQIDKAGEIMLSSSDPIEVEAKIKMINDWRTLHLPVLDALQKIIKNVFDENEIPILFSSKRLKRLTSIQYKLDINPDMRLGGLQDIVGLRVVVDSIQTLYRALTILKTYSYDNFLLDPNKIHDYVESPKASGYRSIHLVYKYNSENRDYNGMRVELQIRTKLQHSWAMAVETAGLITNTPLKSSQGESTWLEFFKIVSSLFAIKEKMPLLQEHAATRMDVVALMRAFYKLNVKGNFIDTLKALKVSNEHAKLKKYVDGYYILHINFNAKRVRVTSFSKSDKKEAYRKYSTYEKLVKDGKNAVVLVSVPKMQELQEAYPSYFLDTTEFLNNLDKMLKNYQNLGIK